MFMVIKRLQKGVHFHVKFDFISLVPPDIIDAKSSSDVKVTEGGSVALK